MAPSEDPKKILGAMKNILVGNIVLEKGSSRTIKLVSEEASSLDVLRHQLRDRHIRGAARKLLL